VGNAAPLDLGDDVVHVALAALEDALQIVGIVLEPRELRIDGGFRHLVEVKPARMRSNRSS